MRLVDADALRISALDATKSSEFAFDHCFPYWQFSKCIKEAPTIDPVKHGRWVEAMQGEMHLYPDGQKMCNVCHTIMPSTWNTMPPFCFGCGADMRGEV